MNADAFRHLYNYHFSENRTLWERHVMSLTQEQFTQPIDYSIGSVRNHLVHLMSVDDTWFAGLRGADIPDPLNPDDYSERDAIRADWDKVETRMQHYLNQLRDEDLFIKPFPAGEDENLTLWQVLIHVINHGTDHRAQLLRILNTFGQKTVSQDYIFYAYEHP